MKSILVFGGTGQVGWEIASQAKNQRILCYAPDRKELDITCREAVLQAVARLQPSLVINAAAYTMVDRAESNPAAAFAVNRDGAAHVAEACTKAQLPLIHISTDYVFDGSKRSPYTENDPVAPLSIYGASKLAGEEAVRRLCVQHIILRTAWVYGLHRDNFVKKMLRRSRESNVLQIVNDQYGSPTYANDLANSILELAKRLQSTGSSSPIFGTFHCAGQGGTTWFDFACAIFCLAAPWLGRKPSVEPISTSDREAPAKRPAYSVLDCSRLAKCYGISMRPWGVALSEALRPILFNSDLISELKARS